MSILILDLFLISEVSEIFGTGTLIDSQFQHAEWVYGFFYELEDEPERIARSMRGKCHDEVWNVPVNIILLFIQVRARFGELQLSISRLTGTHKFHKELLRSCCCASMEGERELGSNASEAQRREANNRQNQASQRVSHNETRPPKWAVHRSLASFFFLPLLFCCSFRFISVKLNIFFSPRFLSLSPLFWITSVLLQNKMNGDKVKHTHDIRLFFG